METRVIRSTERDSKEVKPCRNTFVAKVILEHEAKFSFNLGVIRKNGQIPLHHHPEMQLDYIESGSAKMTVDGKDYVLESGDTILLPGDATHGMESVDPEKELTYIEMKYL